MKRWNRKKGENYEGTEKEKGVGCGESFLLQLFSKSYGFKTEISKILKTSYPSPSSPTPEGLLALFRASFEIRSHNVFLDSSLYIEETRFNHVIQMCALYSVMKWVLIVT